MLMPGLEAGHAITDLLWGSVNPSGRLPLTFPNSENEINMSPRQWPGVNETVSYYSEKLEVGYRWYHAHQVTPKYAFGATKSTCSRLRITWARLATFATIAVGSAYTLPPEHSERHVVLLVVDDGSCISAAYPYDCDGACIAATDCAGREDDLRSAERKGDQGTPSMTMTAAARGISRNNKHEEKIQ